MKKVFLLTCTLCIVFFLRAQTVSNVMAQQVGNTVEITYDLSEAATVSVQLSRDGGSTYTYTPKSVTGDIDTVSQGGHKKMVWNLLSDATDWDIQRARFKISAVDDSQMTITVAGVQFKMIKVAGGTFTMGCTSEQGGDCDSDEKPAHQVTLSDYYIGQTEVTVGLWRAVMGNDPSYFKKGDNYPVEYVSWNDCQDFIRKLNSLTGKNFSLPTEAQWEYAARGGNKSGHYKYAGSYSIGNVAWYGDNSGGATHPVATKAPNELGIYDMSGNVWEWCKDWYGSYSSSSQTNPTGASSGSNRVLRGGSWNNRARHCRVSDRNYCSPDLRYSSDGLRLVLVP